jgi:shikimate kinase
MKYERIYLVGFMGAGKTTVGSLVARQLRWNFIDLDEVIEAGEKLSVPDIFRTRGEAEFRDLEHKYLERLSTKPNVIVALGGGAFVRADNRELAERTGLTVWLKVSFQKVAERVKIDGSRPMFQNREQAQRLFETREPVYRLARVHLSTDNKPRDEVAKEILEVISKA